MAKSKVKQNYYRKITNFGETLVIPSQRTFNRLCRPKQAVFLTKVPKTKDELQSNVCLLFRNSSYKNTMDLITI